MDRHCSVGMLGLMVVVLAVVATFSLGDAKQQQQVQNNGRSRSSGGGNHGASCSRNNTFDYFVLSLNWPASFCLERENACNLALARNRQWLVHGLWPNRARRGWRSRRASGNNGSSGNGNGNRNLDDIAFCCGPSFNASALDAALVRQLSEKWPTLQANGRNQAFWAHEFNKHGTCARGVDRLKSQQQYFSTVLQLYGRFDLNRAPLRSNTEYSLAELHRALDPLVEGKKVRLECSISKGSKGGKNATTSIFSEAHICLDKSLQAINCPRGDDHQCRGKVLFP